MYEPERPIEQPEPEIVGACDRCKIELYEGDPYYDCDGNDLCEDCAQAWLEQHKCIAEKYEREDWVWA